ncbi:MULTISPECIES: cupin domain-containing protein [Nocardia]|uniref:cupin domain-containing protein n=1 Tax=Nocardia TaxID=1817 RepID=UPI001894BA68|nr:MULTISPECIES: cupin domain-containing protein [Nocardia]MBF6347848.1 cupin domain-containing protein [Nocardia flavorosea]
MEKFSVEAMARELLQRANAVPARRAAATMYGGHEHRLRQTVVALAAGTALGEHENPGEATVLVLHGRVQLHTAGASWDGRHGDLLIVPQARHSLEAIDDAVVLLTVAK